MENYTLNVFDLNSKQTTQHLLVVERGLHSANGNVIWKVKLDFMDDLIEIENEYLLSGAINKIREIIEPKGFRILVKCSDYDAFHSRMLADTSAGTKIFKTNEKKENGYAVYHVLDESDNHSVVSLPEQRKNEEAFLNGFKKKNFILRFPKYKGTLTAILFCVLSIFTVITPVIQIGSIVIGLPVLYLVQYCLKNQHFINECTIELVWTCVVFISLSLITSIIYYLGQFKDKAPFTIKHFSLILLMQFCLLQTPFFIFEVGTYYNCSSDGQTMIAVLFSSPKVSVAMIFWGVVYDILNKLKNKETY